MKGFTHFYARYGLALAMIEKAATSLENLTAADYSELLSAGLLHFRVKVVGNWKGQDKIEFQYAGLQKGDTEAGIFLSPCILTTDLAAQKLWGKIEEFKTALSKPKIDWNKKEAANQSYVPIAGEYTNGKNARQTANIPFIEAMCCAITTTTTDKPSYTSFGKGGKPLNNVILPDLPLDEMRHFITVFRRVSKFKTDKLMEGKVSKKEEKKTVVEKPGRPALIRGNFPNAPKSISLRALGLLGAIGEWAKESDDTGLAPKVLKSLETCPIYLISPETTRITSFNHFVVKLARENRLNSIIDSLHYVAPFSLNRKSDLKEKEREREKVAFFAARFLHLFDEMSFREFLAVRAEYPYQLEILFKTFFMEKKLIDPQIVVSAKHLGSWLNYVAYKVAASEEPEKLRENKAKILVQLESSAFSAKSGTALVAQVVTQAGRFSQTDAPAEAELFMEKTMSGELELKDAQQMLMAFARLRNKFEPKPTPYSGEGSDEASEEPEDYSDAQDNE